MIYLLDIDMYNSLNYINSKYCFKYNNRDNWLVYLKSYTTHYSASKKLESDKNEVEAWSRKTILVGPGFNIEMVKLVEAASKVRKFSQNDT